MAAISGVIDRVSSQSARRPDDEENPRVVRLIQSGLTEVDGEYIATGFLDIASINSLLIDDYQRERLTGKGKGNLLRAVDAGKRLPSIVLGLRGQNFHERGSVMTLDGDVYIIDGLQRISALQKHALENPDDAKKLLIGAEVRFNTTKQSEKELFHVLNMDRTRMSTNVILRNSRTDYKSVLTLYGLSRNKDCALFNRVQWNQNMARGELVTGVMLVHTSQALFQHIKVTKLGKERRGIFSGGRGGGAGVLGAMSALERRMDTVGQENFRKTIITFWDTIDEIWGVRNIEYQTKTTWLRGNFLIAMANLLSAHTNFWRGNTLVVDTDAKRKLRSFKINDPEVQRLAGAGNMALPILYQLLVNNFNKSKKVNRLRPRSVPMSSAVEEEGDGEE